MNVLAETVFFLLEAIQEIARRRISVVEANNLGVVCQTGKHDSGGIVCSAEFSLFKEMSSL